MKEKHSHRINASPLSTAPVFHASLVTTPYSAGGANRCVHRFAQSAFGKVSGCGESEF